MSQSYKPLEAALKTDDYQTPRKNSNPTNAINFSAHSTVKHNFANINVTSPTPSVSCPGRCTFGGNCHLCQGGTPDATTASEDTAPINQPPRTETPQRGEETSEETPASAPSQSLSWHHVLRSTNDALWWFCGEHPRWFSTNAHLRAEGFTDPAQLTWRITGGSDKVAFSSHRVGEEVVVESLAGSVRQDDVSIEVKEGSRPDAAAYTGHITVRKPHRLIQIPPVMHYDIAAGGRWDRTEIQYRVVDNMGGSIIGATVNERFPDGAAKAATSRINNWPDPTNFTSIPWWDSTTDDLGVDASFVDTWSVSGPLIPAPVSSADPNAGTPVDRIRQEFYVGSKTQGSGCRVQTNFVQRYLGFALHESIVTPAP